jgi:hypothetical protein
MILMMMMMMQEEEEEGADAVARMPVDQTLSVAAADRWCCCSGQ